ncbi:MAG TPA: DUF1801 domain-containing protein [Vicinamibacteria bacterium]|nr:DUF1801 domain-containing protein [Vicinamibacteria bacterium]
MHSDAITVDGYIASFDGEKSDLLKKLRQAILEVAPNAVESMKHRLPFYEIGPDAFAFAVQKRYLSVYINNEDLITKHAAHIGKHSRGKNCIRYSKPEHVDLPGLAALIRAVYGKRA